MITNRLKLEVHGLNEVNRIALEQLIHIYPLLKENEGKKICLASSNGFTKNFKPQFLTPEVNKCEGIGENYPRWRGAYIDASSSTIWLKVRISMGYENLAHYYEQNVYLGQMKGGLILEKVNDLDTIMKDYELGQYINAEEEDARIQEYREAEKTAHKLRRQIKVSLDKF